MLLKLLNKIQKISEFKKLSLITLILIFYDIFFIKSPIKFFKDILGSRYIVNYSLSIVALIFFILIINSLFKGKIFSKIFASLLLIIPLGIQAAHYAFYNMPVSAYGIRFFFSEPLLTMQLGFENLNYFKIITFVLFCTFLIFLFNQSKNKTKYTNLFSFIYFSLYVTIVILCGMNWYLILNFQHSITSAYASIPETARSLYFKKLKKDKPEISLNPTDKKLPNILWIIGESVAKSHMSLYGYSRKTTPNMDSLHEKGELIPFQNVVSVGPHTLISVPYMLVGRQNIDPHGVIYSSPHIFEYAKARGYDTAFISSQDLRWKNFDQLSGKNIADFYRAGTDFSSNVSVAKGADDLFVLNSSTIPHLNQMRPPFFMVTQMDGSHYPYNIHSEKQYKKFFPETSPNGTNAYDNTIVYSDIYLSKLIEAARKKDPNIWIFYTTDHGQNVPLAKDVIEQKSQNTDKIHTEKETQEEKKSVFANWREKIDKMFEEKDTNDDESKITFNQGYDHDIIHNAFFIVPPLNQKETIIAQQNSPVSQSDIFATILNLMDIEYPASHIDGLSLLKPIPQNRLRISTGFVVTNDNVPEAQVTLPDKSSYFIDFSRKSVSSSKDKKVMRFEEAPQEIQALFKQDQKKNTIKSASL